jgi:hypothetical protein
MTFLFKQGLGSNKLLLIEQMDCTFEWIRQCILLGFIIYLKRDSKINQEIRGDGRIV